MLNLQVQPRQLVYAAVFFGASCLANAAAGDCGPDRPCGPSAMKGPLALLIPQGVAGADFKPACRRHDRCYGTLGSDKGSCDRRFLVDMQSACSDSRRPRLCRTVARIMHLTMATEASLKAFARGQAKAMSGHSTIFEH